MHLPTFSTRSVTTLRASGPGRPSKVREGRRMASNLRRQAHDDSHQRIAAQVRFGPLTQNDHEPGSGPLLLTRLLYVRADDAEVRGKQVNAAALHEPPSRRGLGTKPGRVGPFADSSGRRECCGRRRTGAGVAVGPAQE